MPLLGFHAERREPEMGAQPIRLAPNYTVYLQIEFFGGPRHKDVLIGGKSPELDVVKATWLLRIVGAWVATASKENRQPDTLMTWRQPCAQIVAQSKSEGWSEEKREAMMKHHIYNVTDYEERDGWITFKAYYHGIEEPQARSPIPL